MPEVGPLRLLLVGVGITVEAARETCRGFRVYGWMTPAHAWRMRFFAVKGRDIRPPAGGNYMRICPGQPFALQNSKIMESSQPLALPGALASSKSGNI
ncbi:MAG: hypothetical protein D9V47_01535 [Clostridia bacterium]|nr:MAG: hypothetical protein D9V47_01535 [Clostridia bacterium]